MVKWFQLLFLLSAGVRVGGSIGFFVFVVCLFFSFTFVYSCAIIITPLYILMFQARCVGCVGVGGAIWSYN